MKPILRYILLPFLFLLFAAWSLFQHGKMREIIADARTGQERRRRDRWLRAHMPVRDPFTHSTSTAAGRE